VGKYVGVYFDDRYVGVACAVDEPRSDRLSLIGSGDSSCGFGALRQRGIPMKHVHAPDDS
jgi:hypothetical protein